MTHFVFLFCYFLKKQQQQKNKTKQIHRKWKRSCDRENCERPVTYDKGFEH